MAGPAAKPVRIVLRVQNSDPNQDAPHVWEPGDHVYTCSPRGVGETRWTHRNPPNYVERSHVLLGRTVDAGRIWDIIAAARFLYAKYNGATPVYLAGEGPAAGLAAYAALWTPEVAGVIAINPPASHMGANAPQFLNVLRVCDIPDVFGMLAPRPLTLQGYSGEALKKVTQIYAAAGASEKLVVNPDKK